MLVFEGVSELVGEHELELSSGLDRALDQEDAFVEIVVRGVDVLDRAGCCGIRSRLLGNDSRELLEADPCSLEAPGAWQPRGVAAPPPGRGLGQPPAKCRKLGGAHHPHPWGAHEAKVAQPLHP